MSTRIAAVCMLVSGAAALLYEVLWIRDLAYVFGGSARALSTVVAAFLTGLALGAWIAGRRIEPSVQLLRTYARLELGIALTAPLVPWIVGLLDRALLDPLWPWIARHDLQTPARFLVAGAVMLPATACMGATLPVLCGAFAGARDEDGALIGRLYGWNTIGGVIGCLLAGFVLIEHVGLWKSRLIAAALNVALAAFAFQLLRRWGSETRTGRPARRGRAAPPPAERTKQSLPVPLWALALLLSSAVSIALELCWSRLVALCVGGTTYAFSIVLAVYLLGLGGGALVYAAAARRHVSPVKLLAASQLALGLLLLCGRPAVEPLLRGIGLTLYEGSAIGEASPPALRGGLALAFSAAIALVPSLLIGIAFPALSDLRVARRREIGAGVGAAYLVSTIGGVAASIATSFFLMPSRGIERTLADVGLVAGLLASALLFALRGGGTARTLRGTLPTLIAAAVVVMLYGVARTHGRWDPRSIYGGVALYGPRALLPGREILSAQDGPAGSVAVFESHGVRALTMNGKVDAATRGDMGTQLLLSWLPELFHDDPREVFVVGWGSGATADAALRYGARVQCAEIEEAVVRVADLFEEVNHGAHRDPGVDLSVDDGRSRLRRADRRFDVIVTEPSNPWLAGMSALFTVEFYELCRERLAEGGVLCQWVQLYWSSAEDFRATFATLSSVFPNVALWRTTSNDTLMLASTRPLRFDPDTIERRSKERPWLAVELADTDVWAQEVPPLSAQLARMVLLEGDEARAFVSGEQRLIRDDLPFLEFSAARRMQANSAPAILETVYARRTTPLYAADALARTLPKHDLAALLRDVAAAEIDSGAARLATPILEEAHGYAPELERLAFLRWLAARREGRSDAAAALLDELERTTPRQLADVAAEQMRARDLDAAWSAIDRLERAIGADTLVEFARGRVLETGLRRSEAVGHYERALELDPGSVDAREALKRLGVRKRRGLPARRGDGRRETRK
jgi:spermidine synthase